MAASQSQIISQSRGNGLVITLLTPQLLEETEIAALEQSLMQAIKSSNIANFVIDFENVTFLSSAVLRVLIKANTAVGERKGLLKLCCIDPKIEEVFKITRLNKVFDIRKNLEAALDSLK